MRVRAPGGASQPRRRGDGRGLAERGFDVLINRSRVLERDGASPRHRADDVNHLCRGCPCGIDGRPERRVALVHSAEMADVADRAGYALYLCGHTHGGQIACLAAKPIFTSSRVAGTQPLACGGRMTGYTNSGLGVSSPIVRFNSRGEVAVITLRREMVGAVWIEPTTPPV